MKKILKLGIVLMLLATLVACGGDSTVKENEKPVEKPIEKKEEAKELVYTEEDIEQAIFNGIDELKALEDKGAKITGKTLLFAVEWSNMEMVDYILKADIDVNVVNDEGSNALMIAITHGKYDMLKKLVDAGVELDTKNNYGETVKDVAKTSDANYLLLLNLNILKVNDLTDDQKLDITTELGIAMKKGELEKIKVYLENGVDPLYSVKNEYDEYNYPTRGFFLESNNYENGEEEAIIQMLIDSGFDFNQKVVDYYYEFSLIESMVHNFSVESLKLIFKNGCKCDMNTLFAAIYSENLEKVKLVAELIIAEKGKDYVLNYEGIDDFDYDENIRTVFTASKNLNNQEIAKYFEELKKGE